MVGVADGVVRHNRLDDAGVKVGVNNCGSFNLTPAGLEFHLIDFGGNGGGWLAPWMLLNTITCDDRPPVVPPPPPSEWRNSQR